MRWPTWISGATRDRIGAVALGCGCFLVIHLGAHSVSHETLLLVIDLWAGVTAIGAVVLALETPPWSMEASHAGGNRGEDAMDSKQAPPRE